MARQPAVHPCLPVLRRYALKLHNFGTFYLIRLCMGIGYTVPEGKNINDFRSFIEQLPLVDTPEIFGLHPNAELTFSATQGNEILGTIMSVQPKESSGAGGETREDAVLRLAADLLTKLPPDYNFVKVKQQIEKLGGPIPLNVCLRQEVERTQVHRRCIHVKYLV